VSQKYNPENSRLLHNAWEKVPSKTLEKCWKKIFKFNNGYDVEDNDDPENLIPLNILRNTKYNSLISRGN
jgi:hypothetical protein